MLLNPSKSYSILLISLRSHLIPHMRAWSYFRCGKPWFPHAKSMNINSLLIADRRRQERLTEDRQTPALHRRELRTWSLAHLQEKLLWYRGQIHLQSSPNCRVHIWGTGQAAPSIALGSAAEAKPVNKFPDAALSAKNATYSLKVFYWNPLLN